MLKGIKCLHRILYPRKYFSKWSKIKWFRQKSDIIYYKITWTKRIINWFVKTEGKLHLMKTQMSLKKREHKNKGKKRRRRKGKEKKEKKRKLMKRKGKK